MSSPVLKKGVSIVVCCYNARERLATTLTHLFDQVTSQEIKVEIIVVDNNSTDDTASYSCELSIQRNSKRIPFLVIHEPAQGLAHARRAGVRAASYDTLIFCDDDNWLDDDYVQNAASIMARHPEIGMLGGAIEPASDGPLPAWFYSYGGFYAVGVQAMDSGDISQRGYVWGAGCVLRTAFLRHMYNHMPASLLMGRSGGDLGAGDDSEIAKWVLLSGRRLWYDESLRLRHYMPPGRLQKEHLEKTLKGGKSSVDVLRAYDFLVIRQRPHTSQSLFLRSAYALARNSFSYARLAPAERKLLRIASAVAAKFRFPETYQ